MQLKLRWVAASWHEVLVCLQYSTAHSSLQFNPLYCLISTGRSRLACYHKGNGLHLHSCSSQALCSSSSTCCSNGSSNREELKHLFESTPGKPCRSPSQLALLPLECMNQQRAPLVPSAEQHTRAACQSLSAQC